jgi:hypothetical protein
MFSASVNGALPALAVVMPRQTTKHATAIVLAEPRRRKRKPNETDMTASFVLQAHTSTSHLTPGLRAMRCG